jgi:L-2,4-diaminobutyric acid acetyltransferase
VKVKLRNATQNDFLDVYNFVSNCKPLENYSEHFYKIMLRYFQNTCYLAKFENKIVGFVMCLRSQVEKNKLFLWQIGVSPDYREKRIGEKLLKEVEKQAKEIGCIIVELTVDPENIASQKFFKNNGYLNVSSKEGNVIEVLGKTAVKDYYKPGRHFILYQKEIR